MTSYQKTIVRRRGEHKYALTWSVYDVDITDGGFRVKHLRLSFRHNGPHTEEYPVYQKVHSVTGKTMTLPHAAYGTTYAGTKIVQRSYMKEVWSYLFTEDQLPEAYAIVGRFKRGEWADLLMEAEL